MPDPCPLCRGQGRVPSGRRQYIATCTKCKTETEVTGVALQCEIGVEKMDKRKPVKEPLGVEILGCPWCGCSKIKVVNESESVPVCLGCGASGPPVNDESVKRVIDIWNLRNDPSLRDID